MSFVQPDRASATAQCSVTGCGRPIRTRGWCATHYRRWQRHGHPQSDLAIAPRNPDATSYAAVRRRLVVQLGPAPARRCGDCGADAVCWSYAGTDPDERTDARRGVPYSLTVAHYRARCRPCHRRASARTTGQPLDPGRVERAARLYLAGASAAGIAALLGSSPAVVRSALRAAGIPLRAPGRPAGQPRTTTDPDHRPTSTPAPPP
jgi:hypothetical protein